MTSHPVLKRLSRATLLAAVAVLALAACGDDDGETMPGACGEDTPLVTWETFGLGFLSTYCQGCHASTTPDRQGAPPNITFDTEQEAVALSDLILTTVTSDTPTMPPNGGPSEADRERLTVWLNCFAE